MYSRGSPISYTSCSLTPATVTRPPVPGCFVTSKLPSGYASTIGYPTLARSGMRSQSTRQFPPLHCAPQRFHDGAGAQVGIGRLHAVADVLQGPAGIEVLHAVAARQQLVETAQQVVAADDPNRELPGEAERAARRRDRLRAGARIHPAGVGGDLDTALREDREHPLHQRYKVFGVAEARIPGLLLLHDGHRHLGEV